MTPKAFKFRSEILLAILLVVGFVSAPVAADDDDGQSAIFGNFVVVELEGDDDDDAGPAQTLQGFTDAFAANPSTAGMTLTLVSEVASETMYLFELTSPGDLATINPADFDGVVDSFEVLCECDSPEGGTGSIYVDGIAPTWYENQYTRDRLGLSTAHSVSTGSGVIVAVLDTGIDATHPVFAGRVLPGYDFITDSTDVTDRGDLIDTDGDGVIDELVGHGTFVAGLIHRVAPDAMILPVRVLDGDGVGDSWAVASGIYYALEQGARVINLSLRTSLESEVLDTALSAAEEAGVPVIAAAGNFNQNEPPEFPAMGQPSIGVAALDSFDRKATFSNFHQKLIISAPGASVFRADGTPYLSRSIISTLPGGRFGVWQGTSMAVPLVSGTVALLFEQNPLWPADHDTIDLIVDILAVSAVNIDQVNPNYIGQLGAGRLNTAAAVCPGCPDRPVRARRRGGVTPDGATSGGAAQRGSPDQLGR